MRSLLAWAGAIVTATLAVIAASTATYRADQCFISSAGGGCSTVTLSFNEMLGRFPLQLAAPLGFLGALCVCALATALLAGGSPRARAIGGGFVGGHAILAVPLAYALPQPFFGAVPLLAAAYAGSVFDVILAAAIVPVAWIGGAVSLETLYRFIGPISGVLAVAQPYWGFATAIGVGAGSIAGALGRGLPLSRGLIGAFFTAGAALLLAHVVLEPFFYPNGASVEPGRPGVLILSLAVGVPALALTPFALRLFLGAPWRAAFGGTILILAAASVALAFPLVASPILRPPPG